MSLQRKTFANRTFSKVGVGSIRGSIFALSNSAIGAGVLSLPYVFKLNGYVVATFYIFVGAFAAIWSNRILALNACKFNKKNYNDLIYLAWGKTGSNVLLVSVLLYVFGSLCSYQVILTSMY
jgi:amino acid permease